MRVLRVSCNRHSYPLSHFVKIRDFFGDIQTDFLKQSIAQPETVWREGHTFSSIFHEHIQSN